MNRFKLFGLSRIKVLSAAMVLAATLAVMLASAQPAWACCSNCAGCCDTWGCHAVNDTECEPGGTKVICESDHNFHFVCSFCC
jgi:hypothetical protein